jgi:ATP:ADP antiporter, AAA family
MQQRELKPFGKIRNFFWPIYSFELKKLVPMFALFFLITFIYNVLRCMKTALIVTAPNSGTEVVPYIKTGAVLPAALILTYIFTKLVSRFSREKVFYTMLGGFLSYFALFMLVLYPCHEYLQLDSLADFLQEHIFIGQGFNGLLAIIRHWNYALFYVLCEMWSAVVLSMLFWGFANEVTKVNEAKRFYAIFALGANMSGGFSGMFAKWVAGLPYIPILSAYTIENQWIMYQLISVLVFGAIIISLFCWMNHSVFELENAATLTIPKKNSKISLSECFSYLRESSYLRYIVIIVVGYNIVFNLADIMFTEKMAQTYPSGKDFNSYMNYITQVTSIVAVVLAFFISGNVIRKYGWLAAALITPAIWLITSLGFFPGLVLEQSIYVDFLYTITANPANLILLLGAIQYCVGRACKYTVFDETKEIAFIPLSKENQRKGKAVVDGLASRFGKSGGSLIYIGLFMVCGDIAHAIPYVSVIIFVAIFLWIYAVFGLSRLVNKSIDLEHHDKVVDKGEHPQVQDSNTGGVVVGSA